MYDVVLRFGEIEDDELAGGETSYWVNPFRNVQRMLRSIETNANTPTKTIAYLNAYMDKAIYDLNRTGKIAVYGKNLNTMNFFLQLPGFYWGGQK